ncbi:MAG TPA: hypothetical protein VNR00_10890 [Opitutus sp.]|nr:hypothetical protein [Opitutus sp.]
MFSCRRRLTATLAAVAFTAVAVAKPSPLPPFDGDFSGDLQATRIPRAPLLHWTMQVRSVESGERTATLTLSGPGTTLRAEIGVDAEGDGWWKIASAEFGADAWCPALIAGLGPAFEHVTATGKIVMTGSGVLHAWQPTGRFAFEWTDGRVQNETDGWHVEGVSLLGAFALETPGGFPHSETPAEFSIRTVVSQRFGARNALIRGVLRSDRTFALETAQIEIAGGSASVDPAVIQLAPVVLDLHLRITDVGLQDVAALVPSGLTESSGRVNGALQIGWSEAAGFQLGAGNLVLGESEPAFLRLAPAPGFLTDRVGERIDLLPKSFGPLARWTRPVNPAYADLQAVELGRVALQVTKLSVQLTPEGDANGRTAVVRLRAQPAKPGSLIDEVTFEINVAGPLSQVLKLGLNKGFSVDVR